MFAKGKETTPGGARDSRRDDVLKGLQEEISRAVLSQDAKDDSSLFEREHEDSYSRDRIRGPIIDEFSEDAYHSQSGLFSEGMDFRDSKDQQRREKRNYNPYDEKSSSYKKSREDPQSKRSRSTSSKSSSRNDDGDDLRNVLQQTLQKSKWYDADSSMPDRKRYSSKDYDGKSDRERNSDNLGKSSSSDMFTMSKQGTLEPLSDSRDYLDSGFGGDYRDKDCRKGKKGTYSDSSKERDSRDSRDYSKTRYRSSKQDRRGSLDDGQRDLINNADNRNSGYRMDKHDSLNDTDMGLSLDPYGEPSNLGTSKLGSDALRNLPLTELAQKSSQKFKTGFELGKPFFGFSSDRQEKEEDHFVDFVSILNQYCQKNRLTMPKYDETPGVQGSIGMQVFVKGQTFNAVKYCINKKQARHDAAKSALLGLNIPLGPIFEGESKRGDTWAKSSDSVRDQRDQRHQTSKSTTTTPSLTVSSQSKVSTSSTQKPGPKPLFPAGFLPRNLRTPINKNVQKPGLGKSSDPPPLPKKGGYFPKNMQHSRSRSRSSERSDSKKEVGTSSSSSKRDVMPPSKGKFTTQNWSGLETNNGRQSKENDSLITTRPQGRGRGRGSLKNNNRGRGGVFNPRGRGRGFRGRGAGSGGRGRGIMTIRGRGFVSRGRGRGVSQPPVGATVRNIFRRSKSRSPVDNKYRKSSRSPRRSRSPRSKERGSRSRSSSFCSTCSSHSCSTCRSWRSVSLDGLSGKGDRDGGRKKKHRTKTPSKEEKENNSAKAVVKLKSDIKSMEKQLEQKSAKNVEEKRRDVSKGNREPKTVIEVSKTDVKDKSKPGKPKDKQSSYKDLLAVKEQKEKNSKEVKKEVKKKTDSVREVILKSDKRKESPKLIKKEKESPVREVKIVNEKTKGGKIDEKSGSKMKIDTLKITIDRQEKMPEITKDTKKDKKKVKGEEKPVDSGKRSSRSPTGKQKKKEKVKSKKAKKKAKKRKYDSFSGDSDDESFYSSISGQDEFSGNDERSRSLQAPHDERIVEFSSVGAFDTNSISVHYAKRGKDAGRGNSRQSQNLISIPLPKEPEVSPGRSIPQNVRKPHRKEQQFGHPLGKEGQNDSISSAQYSDLSASMESESGNVDWETAKFANEFQTESAVGEQAFDSSFQESENVNQKWATEQGDGGDSNIYYYEEGADGEGYEQEYYSYPQEEWQTGNQEEYEEWYEGEYLQEGAEGEAGAGYEGEYYLAEDGLYYPVEGEAYQETQDYQGEYIEGGAEGELLDAGQGAVYAEPEGEYQYQYSEEGGEWQQYDETAVYQTEEGWNQGEAEGQWQEEYQEGYQGTEAEWGAEYTQGNEFEAGEQGYAVENTEQGYTVEGTEMLPEEGYNAVEGYDQQLAPEEYYMETVPPQGEGQQQQQQQQLEEMEPVYHEEPLASKNESKDVSLAPSENKGVETKPLKSILKKAKALEGNGAGTKLVSERLAQMKRQAVNKVEIPQRSSSSASSVEPVAKKEQNPEQPGETSVQSESERYREMEEAILSSQPKDAVGTEYVVRVHGSGTANFYCKLCQCHFNTLTAKNLHIKGMKHIELYIRLKSSLLQSVIRDTKVETAKRRVEDDPPTAQKVPRRF